MKILISNQLKMVRIFKKVVLSGMILCGFTSVATQASATTNQIKPSTVETSIPTSISEVNNMPEAIRNEDKDIRRKYVLNQTQLYISQKHSQTLLNEYVKYTFRTPVSQRSADDFYFTFYRNHPEMLRIIEEDGFNRGARGIVYSTKDSTPTSQAAKGLFIQQSSLAEQYMFYFDILKEYINNNGDPKYGKLLSKYSPAYKANLY